MVTLDLLGHGRSDRPADPLVLLDDGLRRAGGRAARPPRRRAGGRRRHLAGRQRVARGGGAGARSGSRAAARDAGPRQRARGRDHGLRAAALRRALPAAHRLGAALGHPARSRAGSCRSGSGSGSTPATSRPAPMAAAVHGIFFGRVAPSSAQRRPITVPALVVGHPADPIHPAADAAMLAEEMPNATLRRGPAASWSGAPRPSGSTPWPPAFATLVLGLGPRRAAAPSYPLTGQNGRVPLYRDEAVVLRTHKLGEADRIITLLTRQHGRVRAVAQGRAAHDVALGLAARAVHPRRPPARRGSQPRHDHPGRDDRPVPLPGSGSTTSATPPAPRCSRPPSGW